MRSKNIYNLWKNQEFITYKLNQEKSIKKLKSLQNRIFVCTILDVLSLCFTFIDLFISKKIKIINLVVLSIVLFNLYSKFRLSKTIKNMKKYAITGEILLPKSDAAFLIEIFSYYVVFDGPKFPNSNKSSESNEVNLTEDDVTAFIKMFKLHNPSQDIYKLSPDELLEFAATHGYTINYSDEKRKKIISMIKVIDSKERKK